LDKLNIILFGIGFFVTLIALIIMLIKNMKVNKAGSMLTFVLIAGIAIMVFGVWITIQQRSLLSINNKTSAVTAKDTSIIGGWEGQTALLSSTVMYFADDQYVAILDSNGSTADGLYELEPLGNKTYKLHIYRMIVRADTSDNPGVHKGEEFLTFFINIKDKNHMDMSKEGDSKIIQLRRIDSTLAKNTIGIGK
jgi:hypothetical protein